MNIVYRVLLICCLLISSKNFAQRFPEFDSLRMKANEALSAKDYVGSLALFERILQLPDNNRPEFSGEFIYNIACLYSLNQKADEAFQYLERSFKLPNDVGAMWASTDTDLEFIRADSRFKKLLTQYFPKAPVDILLKKEISYEQLLQIIASASPNEPIAIRSKTIYWKKEQDEYIMNKSSLPLPNFSQLKESNIQFYDCTFKVNLLWFGESMLGDAYRQKFPYHGLEFESCRFEGNCILMAINLSLPVHIEHSIFEKDFAMIGKVTHEDELINWECIIRDCSFHWAYIFLQPESRIKIRIANNKSLDSSDFRVGTSEVATIKVYDNQFANKNVEFRLGEVDFLQINDNQFNSLQVIDTDITSEFHFTTNKLSGKLLFGKSHFTNEPGNYINWKQIEESGLGLTTNYPSLEFVNLDVGAINITRKAHWEYITGNDSIAIANEHYFDQLMGLYSLFLNLYKNKNNYEQYNQCFIAIKTIQAKRLKYLYTSSPSFENYFRWKLSQLLKFYVRYGTDPARAIVISIYIIIGFGIFFFFFPSDWDVTSKKRLIENYKDFIQKNEKGYIKPFFILMWGFILSLINAFTLSLNAFITLGFGNIPTHGIGRYFCVLEGFLGWFLLSIFTVALINQVL